MMTREIQKTKEEAVSLWNRTKAEDTNRVASINNEKQRTEVSNARIAREREVGRGHSPGWGTLASTHTHTYIYALVWLQTS